MDVNNDGVVSWDDFEQMVQRFDALGFLTEQEKTNFREALKVV